MRVSSLASLGVNTDPDDAITQSAMTTTHSQHVASVPKAVWHGEWPSQATELSLLLTGSRIPATAVGGSRHG